MAGRIAVVGVPADGAPLAGPAADALAAAEVVVGGRRHLSALAPTGARTLPVESDVASVLDAVAAEPGPVCVLASGDPGFFGILRSLSARFGSGRLDVHPAVSSVAVAFARLGLSWDDAVVVSAHGRPLDDAAAALRGVDKAAVLVSPDSPPEALGKALLASGPEVGAAYEVAVCSRLGTSAESVVRTDLPGLAAGTWDPLSVVLLHRAEAAGRHAPTLAWGLPERSFEHRAAMITKSEIRAVVLAKLALPTAGVLWDVGAGSASVAIEASLLCPGLRVIAVERDPEEAERARRNAVVHGAPVEVVKAEAPSGLRDLPPPDRVFVGGGGLPVLDAALAHLRPGGRVVATYAAVDRAAAAAERLGHLVLVGISRGERLPDGGIRLAANNPVFVVWGPEE